MKITIQIIVGAVLTVFLAICCMVTYFGGARQREVGGAYRQARLGMAGRDKSLFSGAEAPVPDNAIEPLERLVELRPRDYPLQMSLVGLYLRPKSPSLDKARALCEKIASEDDPDKSLRALAKVHLGMIEGAEATGPKIAPESRAKKLAAAGKLFQEAAGLDESCGDAYAGMGLIAIWDGKFEEAGKQFDEALKAGRRLGIEVIPEVFNGLGLVAAAGNDFVNARARFADAKRYRTRYAETTGKGGDWKVPDENIRSIEEGTVGAASMDPAVRKKLLAALETRLKTLKGPARLQVLNPIGCGYFHLGDFATAAARLKEAVGLDPERAELWNNLMAARSAILDGARDAWAAADAKAAGKAANGAEGQALEKARAALTAAEKAIDEMADDYVAKAAPTPEVQATLALVRVEMRLRAAGTEKDKAKAGKLAEEADGLLKAALDKFPNEARLVRLAGIRDLEAGRVKEGLERFSKSLAQNAAQPDLRAIVDEFSKPLEVVGFRPASVSGKAGPVLASSPKPLLGALFRTNTGPIPLDPAKVKLMLDGTAQAGIFWGTEYLCMPEKELADGEHVLVAEGEDAMGHKVTAETRFVVDASPPEVVSTEPADGRGVKGPRPKLAVLLKDKYSGVDPTSVEIEIRSMPGAQTLLTDFPVRGGQYTYSYEPLNIKKGEMAGDDKFVFTPTRDLGLGPYSVTVSAGDQRGAKVTKTWSFVVE